MHSWHTLVILTDSSGNRFSYRLYDVEGIRMGRERLLAVWICGEVFATIDCRGFAIEIISGDSAGALGS